MLHSKKPREQSGRDSFSRYRAQVRSAAMASLSILEGKGVDRVYCDFHDDFVVRENKANGVFYTFYQVKTKNKQNHNWSLNELFGLKSNIKDKSKQDTDKIRDSFIGKLLLHTVVFDECCHAVIFQTNINNSDAVESLYNDIASGCFNNQFAEVLIERFNNVFSQELKSNLPDPDVKEKLSKLKLETDVTYLKENYDHFEPLARHKIYNFSEVDLEYAEAREILIKLLELVERKSSGVISVLTKESIEDAAGICVEDLLSVLSISSDAYDNLQKGGDSKAIKNASIIQRTLEAAGAGDKEIEYCSRCKTNWDLWLRNNRHVVPELELQTIYSKIRKTLLSATQDQASVNLGDLYQPIRDLLTQLEADNLSYDLDLDLVLGGVFSEIVKGKS